MKTLLKKTAVRCGLNIFLCFLLTSTGYLAWLYRLIQLVPGDTPDYLTMVCGYAAQAMGVGIYALILRRMTLKRVFVMNCALIGHFLCLIPAVLSPSAEGTITFGLLMNLFCGMIAGGYLRELATVPTNRRALTFGAAYAAATLGSWMLSLIGNGVLGRGYPAIVVCLILTVFAFLSLSVAKTDGTVEAAESTERLPRKLLPLLMLASGVVFVFSLVNNIGFSFPTEDIENGLSLELSRVFYAAGLLCAGFVSDKSRKNGAICALAALAIPFVLLALRGEPLSSYIFWALGYLAFGFYSVYRIILFADLSDSLHALWLSGMGLLIGRVGDMSGKLICLIAKGHEVVLIALAAALFIIAVLLLFRLSQRLYIPQAERKRSEREIFNSFSDKHDLSMREREVLRHLLEEQTTAQMADSLGVSESTVKFHIHNLLKKTGAKNRVELMSLYHTER